MLESSLIFLYFYYILSMLSYITQVMLAFPSHLHFFHSEIAFVYQVLCTIICHRRSRYSFLFEYTVMRACDACWCSVGAVCNIGQPAYLT